MTYNFSNRLDLLGKRMKEINSREVTYIRNNVGACQLQATCVEYTAAEIMALGLPVDLKYRTYSFSINDLVIAGFKTTPEHGDKISDGPITIRIIPLSSDQPLYKYTTQSRLRIMIGGEVISENTQGISSSESI